MARYKLLFAALLLALAMSGSGGMFGTVAAQPVLAPADRVVDGILCSRVHTLGIDRQMNLHASYIMIACGLEPGSLTDSGRTSGNVSLPANAIPASTANYGGPDVSLNSDNSINPNAIQEDSMVWGNGNTILVAYDARYNPPNCYGGISISTNSGASFVREGGNAGPLCNGHGTNYGDPIVVFNAHLGQWFAGDLATGCGGQGVGIWSSSDGRNWTAASPGCALNSSSGDRESMWVDNNPASPHYGRMYVSFNDFAVDAGALVVSYSDDGATWSAPLAVYAGSGFRRNQLLTGSQGSDGTIYLAAMDEGGGGLSNRQNYMFKSTDGGATFSQIYAGPVFLGPGNSTCSGYFVAINGNWRFMGEGQPAATANGVVALDYGVRGSNGDGSDVYLVRSTDFGATWSAPLKLNTDNTSHEQWLPSLSASASGALFATWYDRRNTTDGLNYQLYDRLSTDGGTTWQPDQPVSDILITQPQVFGGEQNCYLVGNSVQSANGNIALVTWLEGRIQINSSILPNIYFDKVDMSGARQRR